MLHKYNKQKDNIIDEDIYEEFSYILSGCDTVVDAIYFAKIYLSKYEDTRNYENNKEFIHSLINGKYYIDNIDINTKLNILNDILQSPTKDDAVIIVNNVNEKTTDDVYKRTLNRIVNRKYSKINDNRNKNRNTISKQCPHCNYVVNINSSNLLDGYMICGYSDEQKGYDWNGCGNDWCVVCGKKLCKTWTSHGLHLSFNRTHNEECCTKHAKDNNKDYFTDYCQCNNIHVNRNNKSIISELIGL